MAQGNLKQALEYAAQNPASDFALKLASMANTGKLDTEAQKFGIDLEPIKQYATEQETKKQTSGNQFVEKPKGFFAKASDFVSSIIGGKELARGAGLALATPEVQKSLDESRINLTEQQTQLLQQIKEKRAKGEDTSNLANALRTNQAELNKIADAFSDFAETLPTSKQVVGSAARLAGTLSGGVLTKAAGKLVGVGKATGLVSGAMRGTGAGAVAGTVEGAIQGAGLAAEQDKSTEEIMMSGLLGAGTGAVTGGIVGGIVGGVSGRIQGKRIKAEEFSKELVSPKQTAKIRAEAIQQGRLEDPSLFKKAEIVASKRDITLAGAVDDVVSPKATIGENIDAIRLKVNRTNSGVKDFITNNKVPFNNNQLRAKLIEGKNDLSLIFASDTNAEKTYNAVTNAFIENVKKGDTLGLFEARQSFDQLPAIKKLLNSDVLGENARKEIVLTVRRAANDYIASQLPQGNQYRQLLLQESYMLEALGNISEKAVKIIGKNKLQLLTEQYPVLKWLVGGIGAGLAGAAGIGVGGAIIGSTD